MRKYVVLLTAFFLFKLNYAEAQPYGCLSNSTGLFYTVHNSGTNYGGAGLANPNAVYCLRPASSTCTITYLILFNSPGTLYSFGALPCPIDDYIPLLFITLAGLTAYRLRHQFPNSTFK